MDLLGEHPVLDLGDDEWRIRSRTAAEPPQYIGSDAEVRNSIVTEGCVIEGTVINSVLSNGVTVEKGAVVKDSIIMSETTVGEGSRVEYSILDEHVTLGADCRIGADKQTTKDVTVIGADAVLEANTDIEPGTIYSAKNGKGGSIK